MAEPENVGNVEQSAEATQSEERKSGGKLMSLLVPIVATLVFAGGGFFVGRMFGTRGNAQNVAAAEESGVQEEAAEQKTSDEDAEAAWFFDMESIVANLNEPGVTRYVRIGLTLGIGEELSEKEGTLILEQKMPLLKNWLTLYVSNQTVADIRGEAKLRAAQDELARMFNTGLFGTGPQHIKQVLFKELSIQ